MERNDLDLVDFWGTGPPYMNFHGYWYPRIVRALGGNYHSYGDFMQRFPLNRFAREHFLKLLGCVMNNNEHNFVDTISKNSTMEGRNSGANPC